MQTQTKQKKHSRMDDLLMHKNIMILIITLFGKTYALARNTYYF